MTDDSINAKLNLPEGTFIKVTRVAESRFYTATTAEGLDVTDMLKPFQKKNAAKAQRALKVVRSVNGLQVRQVELSEFDAAAKAFAATIDGNELHAAAVRAYIKSSPTIRPNDYKVSDLVWKFMVRSVLRGKNLLFKGPQGCGKTSGVFALADVLNRELFNIPLGASQDARSTLIGNVHFKHELGTFVSDSEFVRAIQTANAIILLDEITRAPPDAMNILMSVLDAKQRFLRMDEKPDTPIIRVAKGVTFMATANVGHQFTGTRVLDAALLDRFEVIEVEPLGRDAEIELLNLLIPGVDVVNITAIASIAADSREEIKSEQPKISNLISTRQTIRLAELISDGFTLEEAVEVVVYPFFSDAGGAESERAYVRQIVQKYLPTAYDKKENPFQRKPLPWEDAKTS